MIRIMPSTISERLHDYNQQHLLRMWDSLSPVLQQALSRQIEEIDFDLLERLVRSKRWGRRFTDAVDQTEVNLPQRAKPPAEIVRLAQTPQDRTEWAQAAAEGEQLLAAGRVGIILVAGGQGTRLGCDQPKGMFPISPVQGKPLFQLLAEQALARSKRAKARIPYYVMTSDVTHDETVAFFATNNYFGLPAEDVMFFQQGTMPAVDADSGKLLLAAPGKISTSPDGHGGMLAALDKAGLLEDMQQRGIDYLYYHQVDNPLAIVCDPAFLGFHALRGADVSTKVVAKSGPEEKMGVVVDVDGQTRIIEYSDLPLDVASRRTESGELELWAGSTAMHVFSREFLTRIVDQRLELPFHLAHKKVPYLDDAGTLIEPQEPNAYKFERFIFDVLPHARLALVVEGDREREFNPVKNSTGVNSPEDVKRSLTKLHADWLRQAGATVPEGTPVEISSLFALDAEELAAKLTPGFRCGKTVYLGP